MQALCFPHLSLPPTIPFLRSIFQNCNLRSPAVQGAPECIYCKLHFITHSHTAANIIPSVVQPSCLWPCFFFGFGKVLHQCCMLLSLQLHPCWRRWGELLMACGVQTVVTTTGQAYSPSFSKNLKLKQSRSIRISPSK